MGSVGDAYDNAMAESFFATLERELLNRRRFRTQAEAKIRPIGAPGTPGNEIMPHRSRGEVGQKLYRMLELVDSMIQKVLIEGFLQ
jgi:putative transposase